MSMSYSDICNKLVNAVSGDATGSCCILVSPAGRGKSEIISYLQNHLDPDDVRFMSGSNLFRSEPSKYHVFNEILNEANGEVENRDTKELIDGFVKLFTDNSSNRVVIVIEGLESISEESRDFFLYLARLSEKYNFRLVGTYSSDASQEGDEPDRFLELAKSDKNVQAVIVERLNMDDFKFLLKSKGYNLPDRFVNDLYRLVGGNVDMLRYTLKYYENHRIINEDKEVDDVLYRFFPIPQALEIHYERIFSNLNREQAFLADLIALIDDGATSQKISKLAGIQEPEARKMLADLDKAGILSRKNRRYDISNYRLRDFIQTRISHSRKQEIYSILSESDSFVELPLSMQLNILLQRGKLSLVGKILQEQGPSILHKFWSLKSLISFLTAFLEKRPHSVDAYLTKCEALEMMGESDSAISCYEGAISEFPENIKPRLSLARINSNSGRYDLAIDLIDQTISSSKLDTLGMGMVSLEKSYALMKKRDYAQSYKVAKESRELLKNARSKEKEAEALNILGNICLETFRHDKARRYYEESLEINRSLGMLVNAAKNLNNIAILESYQGNYDETVKIFKELIEESYLTGDLLTRAYSTYNIAEAYYLLGQISEAKSYVPSAISLAKISNRNDLQYRFFRFLSILNLNELDVNGSLETATKALEAVKDNKDGEFYKVAYAMKEFYNVLLTKEDSNILPSLFMQEFPDDEEYLPIFYSMGVIYFVFKGDFANANKTAEICIRRADQMGERYGVLMSRLHKGLALFYQNDVSNLSEFLKSCPETDTGVEKYDFLMKILKLSSVAHSTPMEEYLEGVNRLSENQRSSANLVTLYKETIVMFTLKRVYGASIDFNKIEESIPNNFKGVFNSFMENNPLS